MPQTATTCPRCRQPVMVDVEQLFDTNADPRAKQKILSGAFNRVRCPNCGYDGQLPTPIVYHDPEKELLLTYFPPELGLPVNEQERLVGPMITQVTNRLPPEKRKAYLFRPQTMLTMDTMLDRILEGEGITKEMIQGQQNRLNLLQRLVSASPEARAEMIKQEEAIIDQDFFNIFGRIIEGTMAQGDQQTARQLVAIQQELVANTKYGQELQAQAKEAEDAVKDLQEAGKNGLTREKLLDLLVASAESDNRLGTLVGLARTGLDYNFFEILGKRIDAASGDEKDKLVNLREKLLKMTSEIDQAVQEQVSQIKQQIEELLKQPNIEEIIQQNPGLVNDVFVQLVQSEYEQARQKNDLERSSKLQTILDTIQKLTAPPPEIELVEELIGAGSESERRKLLEENADRINDDFVQLVSGLAMQSEQQGQPPEISQALRDISRLVLRYSMERNLKK